LQSFNQTRLLLLLLPQLIHSRLELLFSLRLTVLIPGSLIQHCLLCLSLLFLLLVPHRLLLCLSLLLFLLLVPLSPSLLFLLLIFSLLLCEVLLQKLMEICGVDSGAGAAAAAAAAVAGIAVFGIRWLYDCYLPSVPSGRRPHGKGCIAVLRRSEEQYRE
jgi:hypothetical protein